MEKPFDIKDNLQENAPDTSVGTAPVGAPEKKNVVSTGALKGLAVTALVFVGVMALVIGAMGLGHGSSGVWNIGTFEVNRVAVTTFAEAAGRAMEKTLNFLAFSPLGWAALATGSALGIYHEYKTTAKQGAAAPDSVDHDKICELTQELELQKSMNKALVNTVEKKKMAEKTSEKQDNIYLAGSTIQDKDFRACELKRRVDVASNIPVNAI